MATANFTFAEVDGAGLAGGYMPALRVPPLAAETIANPSSSTQTAASPGNCYVQITTDDAVFISIGDDPTATAGSGSEILVTSYACFSIAEGQKIAVINAA